MSMIVGLQFFSHLSHVIHLWESYEIKWLFIKDCKNTTSMTGGNVHSQCLLPNNLNITTTISHTCFLSHTKIVQK
jgi:hypothetical protein